MDEIPRPKAKSVPPGAGPGRKLRVIERGDLSRVLDLAVARALRSRPQPCDEDEIRSIQDFVRHEFGRLVRDRAKAVRGIPAAEFKHFERRIGKLSRSLRTTEAALAELAARDESDPGIASVHRTVRGLQANTCNARLKRAMLQSIFEANVALQRAF